MNLQNVVYTDSRQVLSLEKGDIVPPGPIQTGLEDALLSEISRHKRPDTTRFHSHEVPTAAGFIETESTSGLVRGWRRGLGS